jgi:hypothetical protein
MIAQGQLVALPPGEYDWILLRFEAHDGDPSGEVEATVWLHYADGAADPEWLRRPAGAGTCRIPVPRHTPLAALRLPELPALLISEIEPLEVTRV